MAMTAASTPTPTQLSSDHGARLSVTSIKVAPEEPTALQI